MDIVPQLIQVFGWTALCFILTLSLTPTYLRWAKKLGLGKKLREESWIGGKASIFAELHSKKMGTPTMGGVIMWGSVLLIILLSRLMSFLGLIEHSLLQRGLMVKLIIA